MSGFENGIKIKAHGACSRKSGDCYIYHELLGHDLAHQVLRTQMPKCFSAPCLPEFDHSQMYAVKNVLQKPISISLIQWPGAGKTATSTSIVDHLAKIMSVKLPSVEHGYRPAPRRPSWDGMTDLDDRKSQYVETQSGMTAF
ncbi:hypothetical protein DFJ58DRAFT_725066 [Suillus subalutaceus]|uniref:uncharacterized protein n=1 Tax=Suillus subalutaceus TaxID=48586 RepID=UPI001B885DBF|nr:uncharacterized protein DFJ58DRAFT_725066 [Suillus subalutaceus]KAG1863643.1 hypothetical protein DFJ58DRAFT_725066 [Suillus subalutaceus]